MNAREPKHRRLKDSGRLDFSGYLPRVEVQEGTVLEPETPWETEVRVGHILGPASVLLFEGSRLKIEAEDVLLIPPGKAWRIGGEPRRRSVRWLRFSPEFLGDRVFAREYVQDALRVQDPVVLPAGSGEAKSIRSRLEKLQAAKKPAGSEECLLVLIRTAEIVYFLMKVLRKQGGGGRAPSFNRLLPTLNFMQQNLHLKQSVASLAYFSNFSTSRFAHLFIEVMGTSVGRYLMELRMKKAAFLMGTTPMSLERIAASVGISSARVLSRQFKQYHALTPKAYLRGLAKRAVSKKDQSAL